MVDARAWRGGGSLGMENCSPQSYCNQQLSHTEGLNKGTGRFQNLLGAEVRGHSSQC